MSSGQNSQCKRKRRKRDDQGIRNFLCQCGKAYLSYPALYTHIKTKHQDQSIKITKLLQNPSGQPQIIQKIQKNTNKQKQKQKQKQNHDPYPSYGLSLPQVNNIQALRQFLFKYFPNIHANCLPPHYKNQLTMEQKRDLKQMKQYWITHRKQQQLFNQTYQTPLYLVLGRFINQLQVDVQNYCFKKYIYSFVFAIKKALQRIKTLCYFRESTSSQLPILFNQIFKSHLLVDNNQYLSNPTLSTKTIYYLSRWLYVQKFTNYSLKYNF